MKIAREYEQSDKEKAASKRGRRSQRKGKRESEVLKIMQEKFKPVEASIEITRMTQFRGGKWRPDLNTHMRGNLYDQLIHTEAKHDENLSLRAAFMQAVADCKSGTIPVACLKRFREPRIGVLWFDDLLEFELSWLKEQINGNSKT